MIIRVKLRVCDQEVLPWALFSVPGDVTFSSIINGIADGNLIIFYY